MDLEQRFIDRNVIGERIFGLTMQCGHVRCGSKIAELDEVLDNGLSFYCFASDRRPVCEKHADEYSESVVLVTDCEYKFEGNDGWMTEEWMEVADAEPGPEFKIHRSNITPELFIEDRIRTCPRCDSEYELGVGIRGPTGGRYFQCPNCSKLLHPTIDEMT